jgi:hypothetical protein
MSADPTTTNLATPSICIPYVKTTVGRGNVARPVTSQFIQDAFSRYGEIDEVVMKLHSRNSESAACEQRSLDEQYYYVYIHFKRWRVENGEARYVRSVLMSSSPSANIKLAYDNNGPWYWKFYAADTNQILKQLEPRSRREISINQASRVRR